ncbi:GtrA family protein [Pseudonocardia sp. HH130630-07]|uniref:GtrA family protein n=1 Tax=Pseudonocardia sp. HH130630-07 TaxID=1690815 RepID=UPI000814DE2B|nr:GtrA family protein [Pseudonocardia sp. HH130630-07]ANY06607.1 polysaccharide synthesis protein GtrA [Pseudonocardia sp. HH130630-07]
MTATEPTQAASPAADGSAEPAPRGSAEPAPRHGLLRQLGSFVAIGALSAVVDFGVYHLLLNLGLWVPVAKGISFILGTTTAYLLNKRFTFTGAGTGGRGRFAGFVALYGTTFAVNVSVNSLVLHLLPPMTHAESLAWLVAQGTATAINFVMLRYVIFKD